MNAWRRLAVVAFTATGTLWFAEPASAATCGGLTVTVDIASGEQPTSGNDVILGTSGDDTIFALGGDDLVCGGEGNDTLHGGPGKDDLTGGPGDDHLNGGDGWDVLRPGVGNDVVAGGLYGVDTVDYSDAPAAVTVDLSLDEPQDTGGAGTDTLTSDTYSSPEETAAWGLSIDNVVGSSFNDTLRTRPRWGEAHGGAGDDMIYSTYDVAASSNHHGLYGDAGNDQLVGDASNDFLNGGAGNDTLVGGAGTNTLEGGTGNDLLKPGPNADAVYGNVHGEYDPGIDTVSYELATAPVTVTLLAPLNTYQDTRGAGYDHLYRDIENLIGSGFGDTLTGDALANRIDGAGGNDTIVGDSGNDNLIGGSGNDVIVPGLGNDKVDGGTGTDRIAFTDAVYGVTFSLADTTWQATGGAGTDIAKNVENLSGSRKADKLTGSNGPNSLSGRSGADRFYGLGGNDKIYGEDGDDALSGGTGTDSCYGGRGADTQYRCEYRNSIP